MNEPANNDKPLICSSHSGDCKGDVKWYPFLPTDLSSGCSELNDLWLCQYHFTISLSKAVREIDSLRYDIDSLVNELDREHLDCVSQKEVQELISNNDYLMVVSDQVERLKDELWHRHNELGHAGCLEFCNECNLMNL